MQTYDLMMLTVLNSEQRRVNRAEKDVTNQMMMNQQAILLGLMHQMDPERTARVQEKLNEIKSDYDLDDPDFKLYQ